MNDITISAQDINREHALARSCAETAVQHAIRCGELLRIQKEALPHGEFRGWIEANCDLPQSTATLYMKAASQNTTALAFSSLRHLFPSGRAKPATQSPAALPAAKEVEASPMPLAEPAMEDGAPDDDELAAHEAMEREYTASIDKVMGASDALATAHEEIKRLTGLVAILTRSRDQYQNMQGETVRQVKREQYRVARLEKEVARLENENEALRERVAIMETA